MIDNKSTNLPYKESSRCIMVSNIIGGYDLNWLETPSQSELNCLICLSVAREPQQHGDKGCGKMFCKSCISEHQKESTNCPHCRGNLTLFTDVRSKNLKYGVHTVCPGKMCIRKIMSAVFN